VGKDIVQTKAELICSCLFFILPCMLFVYTEKASADFPIQVYSNFPLLPRFSADAYASDYTVGQADLMLPLVGNCAHNFYLDPNLSYGSDSQGYADLGLGYRWIQNNTAILGGYLFGGYSHIENNARIWVANPGIEVLGSRWDAHLNAYFPMGDRNKTLIQESNSFSNVFFTGHSEYVTNFSSFTQANQYTGGGGDIKLGYQLFPQTSLKGYIGSYFFAPHLGHVWGGAAGLEYWLASYLKVFASYTYDNLRHSTGALGLGVEFGGTHLHRTNPSLAERITDPAERYLSDLGRGSAIPSRKSTPLIVESTSTQLLLDNIAFFSPTGDPPVVTIASCTFENPCGPADFTQANIDALASLLPNTIFYFSPGTYPALDDTGTVGVTLRANQSLHSRTTNYMQLAVGADRSTFQGAFILSDNDTLENVILLPTVATVNGAGITTTDTSNSLITGSQIGDIFNPFQEDVYNTGTTGSDIILNSTLFSSFINVYLLGSSSATIQNSFLQSSAGGPEGSAGAAATGAGFITITNSQINATGTGSSAALVSTGSSRIVASNSLLSVVGPNDTWGAFTESSASIQITNGLLRVIGGGITNGGSNIVINGTTCVLNGVPVPGC
jgi:hypothetical protein